MPVNDRQNHLNQIVEKRNQSKLSTDESRTQEKIVKHPLPQTEQVIDEVNPEDYKVEVLLSETENKEQDANEQIRLMGKDFSPTAKLVMEIVFNYIHDMDPQYHIDKEHGIASQRSLYNALKTMYNVVEDKDFPALYKAILTLFNTHKQGVFKDENVYRFVSEWDVPEEDDMAFRRMLNLILATRDPHTRRKALKQIRNWGYIFEYGFTEKGANRVRAFYQL